MLITLFLSLSAWSAELCNRTRADIAESLITPANRIEFKNRGGLFNGGVCWWHSRMQRSSLYLAQYEPGLPRPSSKQALAIFLSLKAMNKVVIIPGYEDFNSFTKDFQNEAQSVLDYWQRQDGIINFEWRRGISGKSSLPAPLMKQQMQKLHHYFVNSPLPVWVMAQMKGIIAHSFLIRNMQSFPDGYSLEVIDSNKPKEIRTVRYRFGDQSLKLEGVKEPKPFVAYVGFQEDFLRIQKSLKTFCQGKTLMESDLFPETIMPGVIEPNLGKKR